MTELLHKKLTIIDKYNTETKSFEPWFACYDCSSYSEFRYLIPYNQKIKEDDIRKAIEKKLAEHNKKINEPWHQASDEVKRNSVIYYLPKNNLWELRFQPSEGGEEMRDLFGILEQGNVSKAWNKFTEELITRRIK